MINIFYHMYCVNNYVELFENTLGKIKRSGLYDIIDKIYLCANYNEEIVFNKNIKEDIKINIKTFNENTHGEFNTLNSLWDFCQNNDGKVLYLHSKGVTRPNQQPVSDWRDFMEYYAIEKYSNCLDKLNEYDTVGVKLLIENTSSIFHYSGNIWWANTSYIKKIKQLKNCERFNDRMYCELWLLDNNFHRAFSMFNTDKGNYSERFLRQEYIYV